LITQRNVDRLGPGEVIWDAGKGSVTGFGARRQRGAAVTYVLKYRTARGGQRWHTIGRHGSPWTPETARAEAKRLMGVIVSGGNPAAEREARRAAPTLATIMQRFLEEHAETKLRPKTAHDYRLIVEKMLVPALGPKHLAELTRDDVRAFHHAKRKTPTSANRALAVLKAIFTWADPDGVNPCRHIKPFPERTRERFLSADELARLGKALAAWPGSPFASAAIRLLVFTGARLGEVLSLQWGWIDIERGTARLPDSKTGAKTLHLPPPALAVLASLPRVPGEPYVLGAKRGTTFVEEPWRRIRRAAGLEDVRLHDLRHSFASVAAAGGMGLPIIGKMLGHTQAATTQRYAHLQADPVAAAAATVAERIRAAMQGDSGSGERLRMVPGSAVGSNVSGGFPAD
jgi:integrase